MPALADSPRDTLVCVAPDKVDAIWPHVAPFIASAFQNGRGDDTAEVVKADLDAGRALLWVVWDGSGLLCAATTKIADTPRRRICTVTSCGGREMPRWVAFINELAGLCEVSGADAKAVERGLKTDRRIGPAAYLAPGAAFAGGTLARDVRFLKTLGQRLGRTTPLIDGVEASNRAHREWPNRTLRELFGRLTGRTIAVWGLTYKAGTDTLRRSMSVELCRWLLGEGATVRQGDSFAPRNLPPAKGGCVDALRPAWPICTPIGFLVIARYTCTARAIACSL